MALIECGNKHLYDNEKYAACPFCNRGAAVQMGGDAGMGGRATSTPSKTGPVGGMDMGWTPPPAMGSSMMGGMNNGMNNGWAQHQSQSVINSGPTVMPEEHRRKVVAEGHTVGKYEQEMGIEPIAGWLVCIEGEEKGMAFSLLARNNFIGRNEADVQLKDPTISQNHARISYESKHHKFYLREGENKNGIYLNDVVVYDAKELQPYDVVELGNTKLVFIPFCGPHFNWEDGLTKE